MSLPARDEKGRLRSKTVAFRCSPEEYDEIQMLSDVSGMTKQDYLLARARQREVTVNPNIRVRKYLEQYLIEVRDELKRLSSVSARADILTKLSELLEIIDKL